MNRSNEAPVESEPELYVISASPEAEAAAAEQPSEPEPETTLISASPEVEASVHDLPDGARVNQVEEIEENEPPLHLLQDDGRPRRDEPESEQLPLVLSAKPVPESARLRTDGPHVIGAVVGDDDAIIFMPQQLPPPGGSSAHVRRRERVRALSARGSRVGLSHGKCSGHCGADTRRGRCCAVLGIFGLMGLVFAMRVAVGAVIKSTAVDSGSGVG